MPTFIGTTRAPRTATVSSKAGRPPAGGQLAMMWGEHHQLLIEADRTDAAHLPRSCTPQISPDPPRALK
jgi:hypothetical protein